MKPTSVIAKRYAKAIFSAATNKQLVLSELKTIVNVLSQEPAALEFFKAHLQTDQVKRNVVCQTFQGRGLSSELVQFLMVLVENGRFSHIIEIASEFEALVDIENGIMRGTVRSAVSLSDSAKSRLTEAIMQFLNKKVLLSYSVDPSLVGGVIAQVAGWTFEDALDSHLNRLKEDLNRRAN